MELDNFREVRKHGSAAYGFEKYYMKGKRNCIFVTNHWHDEIEILYVMRGSLYININGNDYIGTKGDIFVVNKSELHELYGKSLDLEYYAFVFNFGMLSFELTDAVQKLFIEPIITGKIKFENNPKADENILAEIIRCNEEKPFGYMLATKALLLRFFSELFESGQYEKCVGIKAGEELKKRIIIYINNEYSRKITLNEISENFNMSPKYFCRFFKNGFGKTFTAYLNEVRTEKAMELIGKGAGITDAAMACGFNNMSYFTRVFRGNTGLNPAQYKKRLKNG